MFLQSPVALAHRLWSSFIDPGAYVIDATCGNGQDTLFLAQFALKDDQGQLLGIDIQQKAIENTLNRLKKQLPEPLLSKIKIFKGCHSQIEHYCPPGADLIVYNLGYLPGDNKQLTTEASTTLMSLNKALTLLKDGGMLSITCYPGHPAGALESQAVLEWAQRQEGSYSSSLFKWLNRSKEAPFLVFIQKRSSERLLELALDKHY